MKATGRFLQASGEPTREGLVPGIGPRRTSLLLTAQMHPVATVALGSLLLVGVLGATRRD